MEYKVEGQLKEWLEQDGRHDLVDAGVVEVDPEELTRLEGECRRYHPYYSVDQVTAWGVFSIVTRRRIATPEQNTIGREATNGVGRVASAVEGTAKEFRALKGAFETQHQQLEKVNIGVNLVEAAVRDTARDLERDIGLVEKATRDVGQHTMTQLGATGDAISKTITEQFGIWHRAEASHEFLEMERRGAEAREARKRELWMWVWRIAILLALIGIMAVRGHAQSTAIIQAGHVVTVTPSCIASHNCFDVDLLNIPHFICDSGCSGGGGGGGTSLADEAAFTEGTTTFTPSGGYYATSPTALTNGQGGTVLLTANRAFHVTNYTAAGAEIFTSGNAAYVQFPVGQLVNQGAASATAWLVTGTGGTFPVTGTFYQSVQPVSWTSQSVSLTGSWPYSGTLGNVGGLGTAGTPSGGVVSIQGVGSGTAVPVSGSFYQTTQPISIASAQVVSGAYASGSISDGAEVTIGAKADAKNAATDTTAISVVSVLKEISSLEQAPASRAVTNIGTFATQSAITAAAGSIASGAIASGAVASGAISSGACASGCIADGGLTTLGAEANAKSTATDTTAVTVQSVLKEISFMAQNPAALPADQSVNTAQVNGVTVLTGAGATGTGAQRETVSQDTTTIAGSAPGTAGTPSANVVSVQGVSSGTVIPVSGTVTANVASATTGGCTMGHFLSAASTNATVIKSSAGTLCMLTAINTTATVYYLKLYDVASGSPTCNSSTVGNTFAVPAATTGAGVAIPLGPFGTAFASGIGACLTGAIADNDNTNAATGITVSYTYK